MALVAKTVKKKSDIRISFFCLLEFKPADEGHL